MKNVYTSIFGLFIIVFFLVSCSGKENAESYMSDQELLEITDTVNSYLDKSETSKSKYENRFIQKSNSKILVNDVRENWKLINDIVTYNGGYMENIQLHNVTEHYYTIKETKDSIFQAHVFTPSVSLTFRIPTEKHLSILKVLDTIAVLYHELNFNNENKGLYFLENNLKIKNRVDIKPKLKDDQNVLDQMDVTERNIVIADEKVNMKVKNVQTIIDSKFAQVSVDLLEEEKSIVIAKSNPNVSIVKPSLMDETINAFVFGWEGLAKLFISIIHIWPLCIIGIGAWIFWNKKYK